MRKIPQNSRYSQPNINDTEGEIYSSFNLDISSKPGTLRVSPRTIVTTDDITDLGVPVAFQVFTDQNAGIQYVWSVAGTFVFRMNLANGLQTTFTKDTSTGTPSGAGVSTSCSSDLSDLVAYGKSHMLLSLRNKVYYYEASSGQWFNVRYDADGNGPGVMPMDLTDGYTHMFCQFGNRVYVTDLNTKVYSILYPFYTNDNTNTIWATSSSYTLDLTNKGYPVTSISTMRNTSDAIWVFTINQQENGCYAFKWNGVQATDPNNSYLIPDASGVLACAIKDDAPWIIDNNGRLLTFNGGVFVEVPFGRLPIKNTKFLKNSLSTLNDRWIHPNAIQVVNGRYIRILINNEYADNSASIEENIASGVWEYDTVARTGWVHVMSLSLYTSTVTDYGQNRVSRVGALYANKDDATAASTNGTMLMGAQLYSDASTTKEVILIDDSNDTLQKYGYIVTPKIFSSEVEEMWQKFYIRHKKLLDSSDSITFKYRQSDVEPTYATITWTSTTTFTTSTDVSAYEGYEVEVIQGKGSGKCAKITSIVNNAGTYTVTVDSAFTGATSGTAKARFQYWIQKGTQTSQTEMSKGFKISDSSSTWVQFKICMLFTGKNQIDDMLIASKPQAQIV